MPRPSLRLLLGSLLCALGAGAVSAQSLPDYEQPPVSYSATAPDDAMTRFQRRLAAGEIALGGTGREVLRAVLDAFGVPAASQMLVFSKTSLQRGRIRPSRPRALYFSDTTTIGWVPGGLIEVATVDAQLGPVFYAVDTTGLPARPARIERDADCLRCHGGTFVRDVPGLFVRSVFPAENGEPLLRHGSVVVDDQTPYDQRWGGWYVTGYRGTLEHRGNAFGREQGDALVFQPHAGRPDELSAFFDPGDYLAATSDVVALAVYEHQTAMQNALTRAAFSARRMLHYQHSLQQTFKEPKTDEPAYDSVRSVFAGAVENVVDRLLFRGEAALPAGMEGHAAFRTAFAAGAPRGPEGRTLKDLDLKDRLFAQRCSYLVYSPMFRALPPPLLARILDRLDAALRGEDPGDRYAYLPAGEKARIRELLLATHPEFRARFGAAAR